MLPAEEDDAKKSSTEMGLRLEVAGEQEHWPRMFNAVPKVFAGEVFAKKKTQGGGYSGFSLNPDSFSSFLIFTL